MYIKLLGCAGGAQPGVDVALRLTGTASRTEIHLQDLVVRLHAAATCVQDPTQLCGPLHFTWPCISVSGNTEPLGIYWDYPYPILGSD